MSDNESICPGGQPEKLSGGQPDKLTGNISSGMVSAQDLGWWEEVCTKLANEFGAANFNSWLRPLQLRSSDQEEVVLAAPTRFMRDWVLSNYVGRIREIWSQLDDLSRRIDIKVFPRVGEPSPAAKQSGEPAKGNESGTKRGNFARANNPNDGAAIASSGAATAAIGSTTGNRQYGSPLDPRFTFDNFVIGKSNELAYAAARRVAESDAVQYNPVYLYAGVGLGKTHLMHAIGLHIRDTMPERKVLYLSAERFMYQFVQALRYKDILSFKERFRSVDVLMIDDVQFISGKNSTQEEFFHTFNALVDGHRQVIISADRSPTDLEGIEERIRSRLGWGLVADIHATDYELRLGILESKADQLSGHRPERKILEFLAHRITSNVRELEGALTRIVAYSSLTGRTITLETAQEILQDLLRSNSRKITIDDIQRQVAEYFNLRMAELLSPRRARDIARPRQVAMYLAKMLTTRSLPDIGRKFGGRDHTTVMYAVRKIEELRAVDSNLDEDIDLLKRMLEK